MRKQMEEQRTETPPPTQGQNNTLKMIRQENLDQLHQDLDSKLRDVENIKANIAKIEADLAAL